MKCWFSGLDLEFDNQKWEQEAKKAGICGQMQGQESGKLEDKAELKASVSKNKSKLWKAVR